MQALGLASGGRISSSYVSEKLGMEIHAARNLVRRLRKQGLLEKVGQDWKNTVGANLYSITGKGEERLSWLEEKFEEDLKEIIQLYLDGFKLAKLSESALKGG